MKNRHNLADEASESRYFFSNNGKEKDTGTLGGV